MKQHHADGDPADLFNVVAYTAAQALSEVLRRCGDDLTRDNVMRQASALKDVELPMLLPGIRLDTGPQDYHPIKQIQLARFDGKRWVRFGGLTRE
jgi:branched-chain amino acid transport system substrate-binding protein